MVVLDIGGDIGALVISTPAELAGVEIEICPAGRRDTPPDEGGEWWAGEWRSHGHSHEESHSHTDEHRRSHEHEHAHEHGPSWPHVAVLPRRVLGPNVCAAVFPGLREGRYDLWIKPDGPTAMSADVAGAEVTTVTWPS